MDAEFRRALVVALRAFADALENEETASEPVVMPAVGSAEAMYHVLREVSRINDEEDRGVTRSEMSAIARRAGMDPRGMAGYYTRSASLLRFKAGSRWITKLGRERLQRLSEHRGEDAA